MMAIASPFVWGRGGAALTPAEIAKRRQIEDAILAQGVDTSPVGHWLQGLARVGNAAAGAFRRGQLDEAEAESQALGTAAYSDVIRTLQSRASTRTGIPTSSDMGAEVAVTAPTGGQPIDMTGNEVYDQFMGTVRSGIDLEDGTKLAVTNPYALAAIAATGKAESGFSPQNVNRTWSDPSESGQAGTAGGIMSWRGPRYQALAATGDLSPAGQARFFLQEDPKLIEALNNAGGVEEAQSLMNGAWKFAGWNRPGGEAANRLSYANSFLPTFQGGGEVAAVTPEAAFEAVTSPGGGALADEVAEFEQTPEYAAQFGSQTGQPMADARFDDRFGDTPLSAEQLQGRNAVARALAERQAGQTLMTQEQTGRQALIQALIEQRGQANAGQNAIATQTAGMPVTGQATQAGGIMQAVNGTNTGGTFGLNPMQIHVAQAMVGQDPLMNEALIRALGNPHMTPEQRTVAQALIERQTRQFDAARQQQAEQEAWYARQQYEEQREARDPYRQAQIEALRRKGQNLINAGDGRLYDPQTKEWIVAPTGSEGKGFRFGGTSVEAQALNGLMDSGALTPEQAQQLGAGKTITGPNGEIIFLTPQGVFGSAPDGKTQRLSTEGVPADGSGVASGNFTITEPKVTLDERRAMGFADRMATSGALIDQHENAGLGTWDQFVRGNDWIPDAAENWMVSEDFQKFDQARRDFVNAQLRRESGAVISDEEFDNANKQYFPQPGDTKDVLRQKARNRQIVIDAMKRDAGPTYGGASADPLAEARKAIAAGANPEAVIKRLRENGINPEGL